MTMLHSLYLDRELLSFGKRSEVFKFNPSWRKSFGGKSNYKFIEKTYLLDRSYAAYICSRNINIGIILAFIHEKETYT